MIVLALGVLVTSLLHLVAAMPALKSRLKTMMGARAYSPIFGIASLLGIAKPAQAVILYRSATRNTLAPTNGLINSGWQWQGNFGGFVGTPIAKNYFITAEHIGTGV